MVSGYQFSIVSELVQFHVENDVDLRESEGAQEPLILINPLLSEEVTTER